MYKFFTLLAVWTPLVALTGCAAAPRSKEAAPASVVFASAERGITQASHATPGLPKNDIPILAAKKQPVLAESAPTLPVSGEERVLALSDFIRLTVERNPRLAQVTFAVETARGRAVQAGLYPNPTVSATGDELGDRTGPGGIWTAPRVSQEIVTANKLGLSRDAALKEVDQATLTLIAERYRIFTEVRQNYFELIVLQRRAEILRELVKLAEKTVENANNLLMAKEAAKIDVVQLEVDLERFRAELEATNRAIPATFRRLAASVGVQDLSYASVADTLDRPLPDYDLESIRVYILGIHPDLRSAQIGVERAELLLRRAQVEPIPNVTLEAGYLRQNQNQSSDWTVGVSLPVPLWNRNQGNIHSAQAQVGEAVKQIGRVQDDLVGRLATAFGTYAPARMRAERYKSAIIPKAEESHQLSLKAYQGGQFEYLRVLQAQRALSEARLEYLRSLGEMWRAASDIAGLMLEDEWPCPPAPPVIPQDPNRAP